MREVEVRLTSEIVEAIDALVSLIRAHRPWEPANRTTVARGLLHHAVRDARIRAHLGAPDPSPLAAPR